ncbi:rhamnulokinase [Niveibacterium terrae]|uniref:rhamnulokinase n=1 Tax=Niveibacterium terrae TaxID=3373598 RepID=UPI003A942B3D
MTITHVAAVDLGASSGRVLLARHDSERATLEIEEVHRFPNGFLRRDGHDCWDTEDLVAQIEQGLDAIIARGITPASLGVDTWGVDYVLLDQEGRLLGQAVSYRDHRTDGVMDQVLAAVGREELYARTGIQFMQFNTIFQLAALKKENPDWLPRVKTLLLMPDYLHYRLGGGLSCEYTNASTTQLLSLKARDWDRPLLRKLGVPEQWFLPLSQPGRTVGEWTAKSGERVKVVLPATHDTASAVVAVPLEDEHSVFISSGTWSLMGLESGQACNDPLALAANVTNEGGVDGSYRVLKNIMGLWLVQRLRDAFPALSFAELAAQAEAAPPLRFLINPNDDRFLNPPSMYEQIRAFCLETGQGAPEGPGEAARCIFESLAFLYRQTLLELGAITTRRFKRIHIVGGGSQNRFLNQLCADFCALPVIAGPVEASALGNITAQLRAHGALADLAAIRSLIRHGFASETVLPHPDVSDSVERHWNRFQDLCRAVPVAQ